jgi:DNA-binding CsgD family transcriptional regulator
MPTLSDAEDAARRLTIARAEQGLPAQDQLHPEPAGIAIVSARGRLIFATPAGEKWLRLLGRDRAADTIEALPAPVRSVISRLGNEQEDGDAAAVIVAATPAGPLRLEASSADGNGAVAVVLAPLAPAPPSLVPEAWHLTDQERRIARLVIAGASNREVAAALFIAEHTVESHLVHIFHKLGVHRRGALAGLLFSGPLVPALDVDDWTRDGVQGSRLEDDHRHETL